MHVTVHGPNQTSVSTKHLKVFFSYDTPVVIVRTHVQDEFDSLADVPQHRNDLIRVIVTEEKHSRTTSKHINAYASLYHADSSKWTRCSQEYIDAVVNDI